MSEQSDSRDEVDVEDLDVNAEHAEDVKGGEVAARRRPTNDITIIKTIDKSSPSL
jgi:hypothetical protein